MWDVTFKGKHKTAKADLCTNSFYYIDVLFVNRFLIRAIFCKLHFQTEKIKYRAIAK